MSTTESPPSEVSAPGLAKRLSTLVYDAMLMIALWMVIGGIFYALINDETIYVALVQVTYVLALFGYFARSWRVSGQTLGMQAWRIKLISTNNQPITYKQCVKRFIWATLSLLCLGLGYFWMLFDKDKLTWQDRFSETRLVNLPKKKKPSDP